MSELATLDDDVRQHLRASLLPHPMLAVLLTGSTSRQYALADSDLDFMVFYRAPESFTPYPEHGSVCGRRMTVEHHDQAGFLARTGDFGWHLGSLRQLLKVRDGVTVLGDEAAIDVVRFVARRAHLSPFLLRTLIEHVRTEASTVRALAPAAAHQVLLGRVELMSTVLLASKPGGPAYSKPKWLLSTLSAAGEHRSIDLIRAFYPPSSDVPAALANLDALVAELDEKRCTENERRLVMTVRDDAYAMSRYRTEDAWPAVRFAVISAYRLVTGSHPVDDLCAGVTLPTPVLRAMGTSVAAEHESPPWQPFEHHIDALCAELADVPRPSSSRIGSDRLVGHLMHAYCANEVFPWMSDQPRRSAP